MPVFFDYNFIRHEFSELGFSFIRKKLCTVRLSRKYLKGHSSYSLGKLCSDLNIPISARHRAMGDADATATLFKLLRDKIAHVDLVRVESKKIALPQHLDRTQYDNLPNTCGVYYLYDQNDLLLYIGKSKDIKNRISSHFRPNIKRRKDIELKNRIAKIDHTTFISELSSLLFEASEIKTHFPPYNVSLKRKRFNYALDLVPNKDGFLELKHFTNTEFVDFYYLYKNKKALDRKKDHFYTTLVGPILGDRDLEKKLTKLQNTLGKDGFNRLLEKQFYQRIPKNDDFHLIFEKADKQEVIYAKNKRPYLIERYDKGELLESISIPSDPEIHAIFWNYIHKNKLKIHN